MSIDTGDRWYLRHIDKVAHAGMFGIQVFLLLPVFISRKTFAGYYRIASVFIAILYAAILEFNQGILFPHRTTDALDFLADVTGAVLGLIAWHYLKNFILGNNTQRGKMLADH